MSPAHHHQVAAPISVNNSWQLTTPNSHQIKIVNGEDPYFGNLEGTSADGDGSNLPTY
jgi:hypothetical protein